MCGQKAEVVNPDECRSERIKIITGRQIDETENVASYCGTGQDIITKTFDEDYKDRNIT